MPKTAKDNSALKEWQARVQEGHAIGQRLLNEAPQILPSGWDAVLYLFNLR